MKQLLPPVIDLSGDEKSVVKQIKEACEAHGFFVVINHGVDRELVRKTREQARWFFGLDTDTKCALTLDPKRKHLRGYASLGAEASDVRWMGIVVSSGTNGCC